MKSLSVRCFILGEKLEGRMAVAAALRIVTLSFLQALLRIPDKRREGKRQKRPKFAGLFRAFVMDFDKDTKNVRSREHWLPAADALFRTKGGKGGRNQSISTCSAPVRHGRRVDVNGRCRRCRRSRRRWSSRGRGWPRRRRRCRSRAARWCRCWWSQAGARRR